jgi:DNA-directed RNA polymerase specialized sigma24 family protein
LAIAPHSGVVGLKISPACSSASQRSLLRYLLARREDAEDVAQETYVKLLGAAGLEQSEARVRAFMFKVATNLAYDRFRRRRVRGQQDDAELVCRTSGATSATDPRRRRRV